jgi:hypothetical protein
MDWNVYSSNGNWNANRKEANDCINSDALQRGIATFRGRLRRRDEGARSFDAVRRNERRRPGPKGPTKELIDAVVETKRRNLVGLSTNRPADHAEYEAFDTVVNAF